MTPNQHETARSPTQVCGCRWNRTQTSDDARVNPRQPPSVRPASCNDRQPGKAAAVSGEKLMKFLAAVALAAMAIGAPALAQQTPAAPPATAAPAFDGKTETGDIAGAKFRIDVPANWNKGVVVMNHGYSPEPRIPA